MGLLGVRNQRSIQALKKVLRAKDPSFVFLMETKLHSDIMNGMKYGLGYSQGVAVSSNGKSGGLSLLWKPSIKVHVCVCNRWYINVFVDSENNGDM